MLDTPPGIATSVAPFKSTSVKAPASSVNTGQEPSSEYSIHNPFHVPMILTSQPVEPLRTRAKQSKGTTSKALCTSQWDAGSGPTSTNAIELSLTKTNSGELPLNVTHSRPAKEKAQSSMHDTLSGITTLVSALQSQNAHDPMFITLLPIVTSIRLKHSLNALFPMRVTPSGIVMLNNQ